MDLSSSTALPLFLGATYLAGFMIGDDLGASAVMGTALALISPMLALVMLAIVGEPCALDEKSGLMRSR